MSRPVPCPCGSSTPYDTCCGVYHRGEREAPDALTLMRSRYAAYAKRDVDYIARTYHPEHPDAKRPPKALRAGIRGAVEKYRYMGLSVLDHTPPDDQGVARVLFLARVFRNGNDYSFVECSEFVRDESGWRYLAGHPTEVKSLREPVESLTVARFASL